MGAAAAVVIGGTGMDNILGSGPNSSSVQENTRRSSAPGTNSSNVASGLSSIFNFKSVINAATKTATAAASVPSTPPHNAAAGNNFYTSTPLPSVVKPEPIVVDIISPPTHAALPQKSIQGIFVFSGRLRTVQCLFFFVNFLFVFFFWFLANTLVKFQSAKEKSHWTLN